MPNKNNRQVSRYRPARGRFFLMSALFVATSLLYSGCDAVVEANNTIRTPTEPISIINLRSGDGFVSFQIKNNTSTALNVTLTIEHESAATFTFLISGFPELHDSEAQFFLPSATADDTATQVRISQLTNGRPYRAVITVSDTNGKILSEPIKQDIMALEAPPEPAPDLIVTHTITHQNALPGSTTQWNATVRNIGAARSPSTTIRYLIINPAGRQSEWSMATVPGIPPDGMEKEMSSFSYPDIAGAYIIRVCVDGVADEHNSNNNCSTGIRIQSVVNSETLRNFATAISLNTPSAGDITRNGEAQYYAVMSATARTVTISIRSSAITPHWFFADDSNMRLATHDSTGQKNTYSYTIRANSRYYIGVNSAQTDATGAYTLHITTPTSKPTAPVNFHAIPTDKSVNLLWDDVEDAASYRVYRADSGNSPVRIGEGAAIVAAAYVDNDIENEQSYSYTVRAVNSVGESGDSATISATPNATAPAHGNSIAGATTIALPSTTNGTLTGSDSSDYFKIVASSAGTLHAYSSGNDNPTGAIVNSSDTVLVSNSGGGVGSNFSLSYDISAAGTYYIRITGDSPGTKTHYYTLTVRLDTASNRIPATPTGLSVAAGDKQITLSWDTVSNATEYRIYRAIGLSTSYARLVPGTKITGTTYVDRGLTNGVIYSYMVRAANASGESVQSADGSAVPRPPMSTMSDPADLIGTWSGPDLFPGRTVTLQFTATKYIFTDFVGATTCDYTATTTEITLRNCDTTTRKDGTYTYSIHMNSLTHRGYTLTKQ